MFEPIFIAGPHGGGKSTLIRRLTQTKFFVENDFDIDFTTDFPDLASLTSFERCLIRLYHRIFIAYYAGKLAVRMPRRSVLTNRAVYDSEAYIHVYRQLGWITPTEYKKLQFVLGQLTWRPYAIVLNPPVRVIMERLKKRYAARTRTTRDRIFAKEDTEQFVTQLHKFFRRYRNNPRVLYLEDDGDVTVQKIISWVRNQRRRTPVRTDYDTLR